MWSMPNRSFAHVDTDSCSDEDDESEEEASETDNEQEKAFLRLEFPEERGEGGMKADVVIRVQGSTSKQLYAHKFILSSKSPVFYKMFKTKRLEEETGMIRIDDATLPVMRAVIGFCYNAKIVFNKEVSSEEVLEVAHKYAIDRLQKVCEEDLVNTMDHSNLPRRLKLAMKFEARSFRAVVTEYWKTHFDEVIDSVLKELC